MKPSFVAVAGAILEQEYEVAAGKRVAGWLNAGAIMFIIGVIGLAIWKIEKARKEHREIKERSRRIANALQDMEYASSWEN